MSDFVFDLPTGRLTLALEKAALPFESLLGIGARHNPKRAFLFVSKVLGKHIPVRPETMRHCHRLLAEQLPDFGDEASVFIGMAETATGLGQGVFEAYLAQHANTQAAYVHSSRVRAQGASAVAFEESHSHATRVWLHLPHTAQQQQHWQQAKHLVLVDDELSTGNTFNNLLAQCLLLAPNVEKVYWVSVADFMGTVREKWLSTSPLPLSIVSLLQGQWQFQSNGVTLSVLQLAQSASGQEPQIPDTGCGRLGIASALHLDKDFLKQHTQHILPQQKVLVLGCGEFMHAALVVAEYVESQYQAVCFVQSTTRSPILQWGAIEHIHHVADPYDEGVPYFVYNVVRENYEHVLICHEGQANAALIETAQHLQAQLLSFTQESHE